MSNKLLKKWEENVVKISAQSEHFSVLVLKVSHSKFWIFQPIYRHLDPGSGFRIRIQAQTECGSNRFRIRNTAKTHQKLRSVNDRDVLRVEITAEMHTGQSLYIFWQSTYLHNINYVLIRRDCGNGLQSNLRPCQRDANIVSRNKWNKQ
jgi:hypothetical protein